MSTHGRHDGDGRTRGQNPRSASAELGRNEIGRRQTARALRVLSAGNRALIRAETEADLYRNICEAITAKGGYPLAWIGFAEDDPAKSVRIAGSSGPGSEYLRSLHLNWKEGPLANGPVGTCIRTGRISVINRAEDDPRFHPWRELARTHGLRSVVSLPFHCAGTVLGALSIYASEPNAFHPREIRLLEELAADLSYGIEAHRARSAQARAEQAALEAATEFRAIFDSTNDAIFIAAFDGHFLEVNRAACQSLGYSREELLRLSIQEIDSPESAALLPGRLALLRERGVACFESTQLGKDGSPVPVELSARAVTHRKIPAVLGVARDVTERKKSDAELRARTAEVERARADAESANRAKSEFLANMSHEIRTPLNGILGFTNLMAESELSPVLREYNEAVRSSAEALLALINDLLDFSRIEAGRQELETVSFRIPECVESAVSAVRPLALAKGIGMHVEVSGELPEWVEGDPHRIRQVLLNLVGNAVKFTDQGQVAVRVSAAPAGGNAAAEMLPIQFEVSDTGIGIPEAHREVIFEPFRQADGSVTRKFGGTGLGLSISKRLVELMKGSISLASRVGAGSTFSFVIPLKAADPPAKAASASGPLLSSAGCGQVPPDRSLSILVAEDHAVNQRLIRRLLEVRRHRVTLCGDGDAVLELWRGNQYDLVLMDIQMPVMDGLEATSRIRSEETKLNRPRTPIVAMTACAMDSDRDRCIRAGVDAYLTKPIRIDALEGALSRLLDAGSTR